MATVRWSGRVYEAIAARRDHRDACDLSHSALQVHLGDDHFAIEMAPVWGNRQPDRGVVSEGAFPTFTWGRDELGTGEMWNSNSLIAWLLARSGLQADLVSLPADGRAPGWSAGLVAAAVRR